VAKNSISLVAVGDVLLDRGVAKQMQTHGCDWPFHNVAPALRGADIAFGNLECPLAARGQKVVKPFVFKADPKAAACLRGAGFDILSLANNHTLDCGRTGLVETMDALRGQHVQWCGAGENRMAAERATVVTVRGLRVAFVGFCDFLPEGVFLNDDKPSIALADEERVRSAVAAARKNADVVVASFHWGAEYQNRPIERQQTLARAAVAGGADLVLGHHPHVLQGAEWLTAHRRRALVIYSLGNFVFDAPARFVKATADTAIFRCTLDKSGVRSAEFLPVQIENARPRPARGDEAKAALQTLKKLCAELGARCEKGKVLP